MSPAAIHGETRRLTARIALTIVVAVMTTLMLFAGGPFEFLASAQQTTPGSVIKWLNPEDGTSTEISMKPDGTGNPTGSGYHLVSVVGGTVPANPSVLYQYQSGNATPVEIGTATRVLQTDTWEFHWNSNIPADGQYTLIAILSSNGSEVSRDSETVTVNNQTPDPSIDPRENQGETVEITDPTNGDRMGFYDPLDSRSYIGVIDVSHSASNTIANLTAYYTTTPPGQDPQWTQCGEETPANAADGIRCELQGQDRPSQVVGVAVVVNDQPIPAPAPEDEDSGDAHRVFAYEQDPTSIVLSGSSNENVTQGTCSQKITAEVRDQFNESVAAVDTDVHALGPDDSTAFDDPDGDSSPSKAPEGHATESGRDCEASGNPPRPPAGSQGFHDDPSGPNRKHIESTTGTDDRGQFSFRLFSNAAPATVQYTVWADEDGNDRLCSQEAQANGSVGFNQAPAAPTGIPPEDTSCPRPTPSSSTTNTTTNTTTSTTTSASPTTASPTPPGGPIEWLNPDDGTSTEISAKADRSGTPTGQSYHLVSTVGTIPPNPNVIYQYQSGSNTPVTIGNAQRVGSTDTWEFHWTAGQMPADGSYTLIAILTSNGTEVARDTESVTVNNTNPATPGDPQQNQAETVEIIDPTNGDVMGFYDPLDDRGYIGVISVSHSTGVSSLTAYYTITPPGEDPVWTPCGEETPSQAEDGIRCELDANDHPNDVTGVAVVVEDQPISSPAPADEDTSDAHRVFGYEANPTSIVLSGNGLGGQFSPGTCSSLIIATIRDQHGNTIAAVDTDVHGRGPNDSMAFDDGDGNSSPNQPPQGHQTESGRDCESTANPRPPAGSQGWHDEPGANTKHIESVEEEGTADDGSFRFRVFSNIAGTVQFTVWADEDANDRMCGQEPQADGSVGFGVNPAAPSGLPDDEATCPAPTPTPSTSSPGPSPSTSSPGPSPSPSASTTSVSPSPSPSTSGPSPSPSTSSPGPSPSTSSPGPSPSTSSPGPSPTPTETQPPDDEPTEVNSFVNGRPTPRGFKGRVASPRRRCETNRRIKVRKQGEGVIAKANTGDDAKWKVRRPNAQGRFRIVVLPKTFENAQGEEFLCEKDRSRLFRRNS